MTPIEVEAWALRIIDTVTASQPVEDSRVELKSVWIDSVSAARRIAGHANASHGEPILWLIGVDEVTGVVHGAKREELSNWWPSVCACFDELAPELLVDVNVPAEARTIVVLLFATDRAPYVVKNPVYGTPKGGSVEREVPWREGTRVRSARRRDLVRMLAPRIHEPSFEILSLMLRLIQQADAAQTLLWELTGELYVTPGSRETLVLPFHRCSLEVVIDLLRLNQWRGFVLHPRISKRRDPKSKSGYISSIDSLTIEATGSEVVIDGPGVLTIRAVTTVAFDRSSFDTQKHAFLTLRMRPASSDHTVVVSQFLEPRWFEDGANVIAAWAYSAEV